MGRQVAPAQAAQVDDAPYAGLFGSPAEGRRQLVVADLEPGPAGHGVHQVVGGIDTDEGTAGGLRVGHVDGHGRDPLAGGQVPRMAAQGQYLVTVPGQPVGQQAAHVAAGPGDGDPGGTRVRLGPVRRSGSAHGRAPGTGVSVPVRAAHQARRCSGSPGPLGWVIGNR